MTRIPRALLTIVLAGGLAMTAACSRTPAGDKGDQANASAPTSPDAAVGGGPGAETTSGVNATTAPTSASGGAASPAGASSAPGPAGTAGMPPTAAGSAAATPGDGQRLNESGRGTPP